MKEVINFMARKKKEEIVKEESFDDELIDNIGKPKKSKADLLSQLEEVSSESYRPEGVTDTSIFLPSSLFEAEPEEKKSDDDEMPDWFDDWKNSRVEFNPKSRMRDSLFEYSGIVGDGKKKKKKKKKDKEELIDYKKEFEPEAALLHNLLLDQNNFVESLQREYDSIMSKKGTSRSVNKSITDLMLTINNARQLAMNIVDKQAALKKQVADLSLKQKKEAGGIVDGENMADFASSYLQQILKNRGALMDTNGDISIGEYTEDELFDEIGVQSDMIEIDDGEENALKYLQYENQNVSIYVVLDPKELSKGGDEEIYYDFIAKDEEGNIIPDYPMPMKTKLSINRSTEVATDIYGQKYHIIWLQ